MNYRIIEPTNDMKSAMIKLWKDTFHDDDKYLKLFFDNYFDPRLCRCVYSDDMLVSMLIGVGYNFHSEYGKLRGLYLCGLSTRESYRCRGIMGKLIEDILSNIEISSEFDFAFLIPADDNLRLYYRKYGFVDASEIYSYKVCDSLRNYIRNSSEDLNIISTRDGDIIVASKVDALSMPLPNSKGNFATSLAQACMEFEGRTLSNSDDISIIHTLNDWRLLIEEKLQAGSLIISRIDYRKAGTQVICIQEDGELFILSGNLTDAESTIKSICDELITSEVLVDMDSCSLNISRIKYGMVRFSAGILPKIQGSENRIFQQDCGILQKYQKMNFDEKLKNLNDTLGGKVNFRLMLD